MLPFGLTTAPYIFTKVLKPLVTHWRSSGIFIALYLDDGLIVVPKPNTTHSPNSRTTTALEVSKHVKIDLFRAGLVYNEGKSNREPNSYIQWFGMIWDTTLGTLRFLQRRVDKLIKTIQTMLSQRLVCIRELHSFVCQVISISPICGNLTVLLMTRHCQIEIAKSDEDFWVTLDHFCRSELQFWIDNVALLNTRHLFSTFKFNIICCDASASESGAIVYNKTHTAHKLWTEDEAKQSSTIKLNLH